MKVKVCRTYDGLIKAIDKGEHAILKYTSRALTTDGHIFYLVNGTNLILSSAAYEKIKEQLVRVI